MTNRSSETFRLSSPLLSHSADLIELNASVREREREKDYILININKSKYYYTRKTISAYFLLLLLRFCISLKEEFCIK